jgi:hypothetical protein
LFCLRQGILFSQPEKRVGGAAAPACRGDFASGPETKQKFY